MNYTKPAIDITAQIAKLKSRGLTINDEAKAAHYLSNISFYRLRAYTYPFQDNTNPAHPFNKPVSFEQIIDVYVFDRRLRLMVFDALEKIEIALRTKIVYQWSLSNGSHWHENANLYRDANRFVRDLNKLYEEVDRSTETFIKHYKDTYTNPTNPASWMSLEVASLGLLSKLFENLKKGPEKKAVTQAFGLHKPEILESWMHCFAHIRNVCAHHSRLWNRRITTKPQIPTNTTYNYITNKNIYPNKIYASLCSISYILNIISPGHTFNKRLLELIHNCPLVDLKEMGFPIGWETEKIWK
jgi:abortive infection bacteriophage resistance protein